MVNPSMKSIARNLKFQWSFYSRVIEWGILSEGIFARLCGERRMNTKKSYITSFCGVSFSNTITFRSVHDSLFHFFHTVDAVKGKTWPEWEETFLLALFSQFSSSLSTTIFPSSLLRPSWLYLRFRKFPVATPVFSFPLLLEFLWVGHSVRFQCEDTNDSVNRFE